MYCSGEQIVERYGADVIAQLTSRGGSGDIDQGVLDAAIADASAEIDMYLAGRYALPLSIVPMPLTRIACALTRDILAVNSDVHDERWNRQSDEARKMLHDIANGRISLGVSEKAQTPGAAAGNVQMESGGRVWDRNGSKGYI